MRIPLAPTVPCIPLTLTNAPVAAPINIPSVHVRHRVDKPIQLVVDGSELKSNDFGGMAPDDGPPQAGEQNKHPAVQ